MNKSNNVTNRLQSVMDIKQLDRQLLMKLSALDLLIINWAAAPTEKDKKTCLLQKTQSQTK